MKLFLINSAKFIALSLSIYCVPLIGYNILLEQRIEDINTLRSSTKILLFGDSHMHRSVNDIDHESLENRAYHSENFYINLHKLKGVIECENNDRVKAVCLSYNFFSLRSSRDSMFVKDSRDNWIDDYKPIYRSAKNLPYLYNLITDNNDISILLRSYLSTNIELIQRVLTSAPKDILPCYKGYFAPSEECNTNDVNLLDAAILRHYGELERFDIDKYISQNQIDILKVTITYLIERDTQLFLVNAPQHEKYNNAVPYELKEFNTQLAQQLHEEYGAIYLDYHDMNLPDSCFLDFDHLNTRGANIFTPILLADIESYLSQTQSQK